MEWISKTPPIYVYGEDTWRNEKDNKTYKPDLANNRWVTDDGEIFFPNKTKVMNGQTAT